MDYISFEYNPTSSRFVYVENNQPQFQQHHQICSTEKSASNEYLKTEELSWNKFGIIHIILRLNLADIFTIIVSQSRSLNFLEVLRRGLQSKYLWLFFLRAAERLRP